MGKKKSKAEKVSKNLPVKVKTAEDLPETFGQISEPEVFPPIPAARSILEDSEGCFIKGVLNFLGNDNPTRSFFEMEMDGDIDYPLFEKDLRLVEDLLDQYISDTRVIDNINIRKERDEKAAALRRILRIVNSMH